MNESSTAFARLADQGRCQIEEISPYELDRAKPLPVIIDVGQPEEYADGYVARAKHLSRGVLEQKIAEVVPEFPLQSFCTAIEESVPRWRRKTSSKWATNTCVR
jgi:hypothetical protein